MSNIFRAIMSFWEDLTYSRALDRGLTPAERADARAAHWHATLAAARGTTPMQEARAAGDTAGERGLREAGWDDAN